MITPGYLPTATERVLPRMALDFTTGSLDPRVTVTRALNTATRVDINGLIVGVTADLPRFDYSPTSVGTPRGLLIEETRANLCIRSSELNTGWTPNSVGVGTNVTTSPSGSADADSVTASAGSAQHRLIGTQSAVSSGVSITHSVFAKAGTINFVQLHDSATATFYANFDLTNGTVTAVNPTNGATITNYGNGWYRCTLTFTTGTTNCGGVVAMIPDGAAARNPTWTALGTELIYAWGYQVEVGAFATSYIPTTTTSLTRNADAVSMTGTNFSSWYNATEGTMFFEGSTFADQGSTTVSFAEVSNGVSTSVTITLGMFTASAALFAVNNTTSQANINLGAFSLNTVLRLTGAYKANSFAASKNGNAAVLDTSGTIPTVSQLIIGQRLGGPYMNGHARKFSYWPQRLTNAEVQAFSK